jgi:hypothetical protein
VGQQVPFRSPKGHRSSPDPHCFMPLQSFGVIESKDSSGRRGVVRILPFRASPSPAASRSCSTNAASERQQDVLATCTLICCCRGIPASCTVALAIPDALDINHIRSFWSVSIYGNDSRLWRVPDIWIVPAPLCYAFLAKGV